MNGENAKYSQAWYYNETSDFDDDSNKASFVQKFYVMNSGPATIKKSIVTIKIPAYAENGEPIISKRISAQESDWSPNVWPENMKLVEGAMRGNREECKFKNWKEVNKRRNAAQTSNKPITTNEFKCGNGATAICIELECYIGEFKVFRCLVLNPYAHFSSSLFLFHLFRIFCNVSFAMTHNHVIN